MLKNPAQGAVLRHASAQLDDTGRANYHGMLLSAQRRLKGGLSTLANYTLSKCMSDPATTEITGPTITDPTNPDLDYSYCDSDRRHVRQRVGRLADADVLEPRAMQRGVRRLADRPAGAVAERQPLLGHDRRRQRACRAWATSARCRCSDDVYGDGSVNNYLNLAAFTSPAAGTYSTLKPNAFVGPVAAAERPRRQPELPVRRAGRSSSAGRSSTC